MLFGARRLAVLERWLPYTLTALDRFHCILLSWVDSHFFSMCSQGRMCFWRVCLCSNTLSVFECTEAPIQVLACVCVYVCVSVSVHGHSYPCCDGRLCLGSGDIEASGFNPFLCWYCEESECKQFMEVLYSTHIAFPFTFHC